MATITREYAIGENVHLGYTSDGPWSSMLKDWKVHNPYGLLLLDSFGYDNEDARWKAIGRTKEAAESLPSDVTICYRLYIENPHDKTGDHHHTFLSPDRWVELHMPFANYRTNVFCVANNEPRFAESIPWLLQVAKKARAKGIRVSLGGFSVGGYQISEIPALRELLVYMAQNPGWFMLDLHEYTRGSWLVDIDAHNHNPANWPRHVGSHVELHLMGRFREIFKYCAKEVIPFPDIFFGEVGFDRVRGDYYDTVYGNVGGIRTLEGFYKSVGHENWQAYAGVQMQGAFTGIYQAYSRYIRGWAFFQRSEDENNWREFNSYYTPTFIDATRKGFVRMYDTQALTPVKKQEPAPVGPAIMQTAETHINLRREDGADLGDIKNNDEVFVLEGSLRNIQVGTTLWVCQPVEFKGQRGFVALTGNYKLNPILTTEDFIGQMRDLLNRYEASQRG